MDNNKPDSLLIAAKAGDIHAFQTLFSAFQDALKSYLFRLMASRADAEDIAHDTFIRAYDNVSGFAGNASLKTWVFQIATNLALNALKKRKRWVEDVKERSKTLVREQPALQQSIEQVRRTSAFGRFDMKEHIDMCFTCMAKTLSIENQVVLILKEVYAFSIAEICMILGKSEGAVKYSLQKARKTMIDIFERRCALINKAGVCHQCSELNGWFNPKQSVQEARMKIKMCREADKKSQEALFRMRTELIKGIDPLRSDGHALQEVLLNCNIEVMKSL